MSITLVASTPYDPECLTQAAPVQFTRWAGNPILSPTPANRWESLVTTNPAAWWDEATQRFLLLYRAAGDEPEHRIRFGLAASTDGFHFDRLGNDPVFAPIDSTWEGGCVEDPRVVKINGWHYVTYPVRMYPPGEYWHLPEHPERMRWTRPEVPPEFPLAARANHTVTGLAATQDFKTWHRFGRITDPRLDIRNVVLFPEKIGGRWWKTIRPLEWVGEAYGCKGPSIWLSSSDDLLAWDEPDTLLLAGRERWEGEKIGANTPPIRTPDGWLMIYHGKADDQHYRLGAVLLDLENPRKVLHRSNRWLLQPEGPGECGGCFYGGVAFPCGLVPRGDTLYLYYGGGDRYCHVATISQSDLLAWLRTCPP